MNNSPTNHDPQRLEQIVAFLDGELSSVDEALMRRQLAEDADLRHELQSMDRAWSALDALPGVTVDDKFSQTTMELVVDAAQNELVAKTMAIPVRRRKQWFAKLLLTAAAAALGWLVVQLVEENPNRMLLSDLPEIEYIDIYSQFQDVSFLRDLQNQLGDTPWATDLSVTDLEDRVHEFNEIATPSGRQEWLAGLEDEGRVALRGKYNRFLAVSQKEQSRLRDLHETVINAPDRDQLVETMLDYQSWLNTLPASQQFELRELPADKRVREIVNFQRREAAGDWIELSAEEVRQLRRALFETRQRLIAQMTPQQRERFENAGMGGRWIALTRQFPELRDQWRTVAIKSLSEEKRAQFAALDEVQQERQLARWMRDIAMREPRERIPGTRQRFNEVSQVELERFFAEELDATTREQLLAQPRDRMEQQLRSLYLRGEQPWGDGTLDRDRFGPANLSPLEPLDHIRRGSGPPREGEREGFGPPGRRGPPEDRPGFGRPLRTREGERPRDLPPRPEEGF